MILLAMIAYLVMAGAIGELAAHPSADEVDELYPCGGTDTPGA